DELIRNILESVDEGFIIIDRDFRIIMANRAFAKEVGMLVEDIIGKHCYDVSHHFPKPCYEAGEKCAVRRVFETGEPDTVTHTHYDSKGDPVYIETKAYPLSKDESGKIMTVIEILVDITEKTKLEDQLRQSQKMEAVGQIAGGIAHDFNNILTAIIGYASITQMKMREDDPLRHNVDQVLVSAERAANLTQGLLAFSRKQISNPTLVNLNELIEKIEKFLRRVIGEDIEFQTILTDKDITVMADHGQIDQALMNLATNARDAMPKGGLLTIETGTVEIDEEYIKAHGYGKAGTYALISVTDSGIGMDEKTREKIFEPFFTTKEVGKGTGLGLSIVYGIIKQHAGYINCYSEPGKGTTFRIYLPLIKTALKEVQPVEVIEPAGGTETILLAEDEENVRELTRIVLEEYGYKVIEAIDGEDAVNKFMENKDRIGLLLLDVIMPQKSGKEAYDRIAKIKPGIKVLFTSGYPADFIHREEITEQGLSFVSKPISPTALLKKVREVLDKR
ncbi:MAG: ATP-binding protein, partial [Nitrospirota bacterium]